MTLFRSRTVKKLPKASSEPILPSSPFNKEITPLPEYKLEKEIEAENSLLRQLSLTMDEKRLEVDQERSPSLNLFTTMPRNFNSFVLKCGPVASIHDKVESIIFWENPTETVLALLVYILICLHPKIFLFMPHIIICLIIMKNYYYKEKYKFKKPLLSESSVKNPYVLKPDEIDYKKNLTFIQNLLGMYREVYAQCRMFNLKLNWSNERQTLLILQLTIFSAVFMYFFLEWIPFQSLFLFGGCLLLLSKTAFGRAAQEVTLDYLKKQSVDLELALFKKWLEQGQLKKEDLPSNEEPVVLVSDGISEMKMNWRKIEILNQMLNVFKPYSVKEVKMDNNIILIKCLSIAKKEVKQIKEINALIAGIENIKHFKYTVESEILTYSIQIDDFSL